jgi:DNA (cytosine-5)-methyltransferase 1
MKYGSVCSGIEAATVAWHHLGWSPQWFSEIDKFPSRLLAHHYPDIPNLGDMTKIHETNKFNESNIDLLVGGTPCQSFSVAGLRKGLDDPRGNLALHFLKIADLARPRWVVWENVPGVLSSSKGRDFGAFLGGLGELGYGWAYRVLDAQYFGVAQRRRRVFVVGYLGDFRRSAAVLFERESLSGNPAPSREKGKGVAAYAQGGFGDYREGEFATLRSSGGDLGGGSETFITDVFPTIDANMDNKFGSNQGVDSGQYVFDPNQITSATNKSVPKPELCHTLPATPNSPISIQDVRGINKAQNGMGINDSGVAYTVDTHATQGVLAPSLTASNDPSRSPQSSEVTQQVAAVHQVSMQVRRLTPIECERLQGFPDNYTNIPKAADGPRYKALGNSMAVPVMCWIGERIDQVDKL